MGWLVVKYGLWLTRAYSMRRGGGAKFECRCSLVFFIKRRLLTSVYMRLNVVTLNTSQAHVSALLLAISSTHQKTMKCSFVKIILLNRTCKCRKPAFATEQFLCSIPKKI